MYDPNNNHISVHTRGHLPNSANENYSLGYTTTIPVMNAGPYLITINYATPPLMQIFIEGFFLLDIQDITIGQVIPLQKDMSAWVGFTASTSDCAILNWNWFSC